MSQAPSLEAVKTAIKTVLSSDPSVDRKQATEWLDAFKGSVHAWEVCDQLLRERDGIEVSYLAAHMLRQKISRNFNELPRECYSSLKDSILNHLQAIDDYAVQGQLTMAIADLTLLLNDWLNPIEDLAKQLGLDVGLSTLLNTSDLTSLSRAVHNRLIFAYIMHQMCDLNHNASERPKRIGAKRREEYEDYLISKCGQAISWWLGTLKEIEELRMSFLASSNLAQNALSELEKQNPPKDLLKTRVQETSDKLVGQIYLCYSAWIRIFDEENVNTSLPLIDAAFNHLRNPYCADTIHKYAVEVAVATSSFCEDSQVDYLVGHLVTQVYTLEEAFKLTLKNEDIEKSTNFAKTFTSVAETACSKYVIQNKDFKVVELLLSCLGHYDFEVVEETYSFWWMFLEILQNQLRAADYAPFVPYFNRFVMAVTTLCQFDPDEDAVIPHDQDIHAFRSNSADIISNVMFVTTVPDFLRDNHILDSLKLDLTKVSWEKIEAILNLLSGLVMMLTQEDNALRMQIFQAILVQQTNQTDFQTLLATKQVPLKIGINAGEVHPQIVATSLTIIGSIENFFTDYPDYLNLAINYILTSISHPVYRIQLIKYASSSLCNVIQVNAARHFSSSPELLMIIKNLCTSLDLFDETASDALLRCGAIMADAIQDTNVVDQFLCEIVNPSINSLKEVLNQPKSDETVPAKYLDRLSTLFREANIHPTKISKLEKFIALIDSELWPVLMKTLEVYASESGHAIERTCRTLRYLIRCIKPEWMIQRVAETMVNLYKTYPQNSSPLYICSILVDEFANRNVEINKGLFAMLEIFCNLTFSLLNMDSSQSKSLLTMKSYPETIDDMMRLFNRFLKKCPSEFVNCKALESIIELSISSLRIDHPDANSNVSKFVTNFITLAQNPESEYPHIRDAIANVLGARFTSAVINACLFDLPPQLISEEATILLALYGFDKNLFSLWISTTVSALPKTNIQGIESITPEQLEDFRMTITNASSQKKMVNVLRAFARLYT